MTDRYKNALDDALKQLMLCFNWHNGYCTEDQKRFHDIIQTEIKQLRNDIKLHIEMGELLATESEQLRKERDELASALNEYYIMYGDRSIISRVDDLLEKAGILND